MSSIRPNLAYPEPVSSDSSVAGFFEQRSFRRLVAVLGIGSAVVLAYSAFKKHLFLPTPSLDDFTKEIEAEIPIPVTIADDVVGDGNVNANEETETEEPPPKKEKVILYQVPRGFFTPVISPFGLTLETFLRVADIEHEVVVRTTIDGSETPWVKVGDEEIKNHKQCISFLTKKFNINLLEEATSSRKTAARLIATLFESKIAWGVALWRWVYDGGRSVKDIQALAPTSAAVLSNIKDSVIRAAEHQGMGSQEDVTATVIQGLADATSALGKHKYFLGNTPGEVDCHVFSLLAQMVWNMPGSPFEKAIKRQPLLIDYVIRMRDQYWPDWADLILQTKENTKQSNENSLSGSPSILHSKSITSTNGSINIAAHSEPEQKLDSGKSLEKMSTVTARQSSLDGPVVAPVNSTPQNSVRPQIIDAAKPPEVTASLPPVSQSQLEQPSAKSTTDQRNADSKIPVANNVPTNIFPSTMTTQYRNEWNSGVRQDVAVPQHQYIPPMQHQRMQMHSYMQMPLTPAPVVYPGVVSHPGQYPRMGDYMSPMSHAPPQYMFAPQNSPYTEDLKRATAAILQPKLQEALERQNQTFTSYCWQ